MTLYRFGLALVLASVLTVPAAAQVALQDSACTYATCALRVEPDFLGARLVRGEGGEAVARISAFGPDLTEIVADSPVALDHARTYERTRTPAILGALATGALLGLALSDVSSEVRIGASLGSIGLGILTIPLSVRSQRAFSRALWEYNGDLPRD